MNQLRLIGWTPGIQTVSLIQAVHEYASLGLSEAKLLVERLLAGDSVLLQFSSEDNMLEFRSLAERFGALTQLERDPDTGEGA